MSEDKTPYVILEAGGKQFRVAEGDVIDVDLIQSPDQAVTFQKILFYSNGKDMKVGAPHLPKTSVEATVLQEEVKGPKVHSFKYKRRKNYRRKIGHRQKYTRVQINKISVGG